MAMHSLLASQSGQLFTVLALVKINGMVSYKLWQSLANNMPVYFPYSPIVYASCICLPSNYVLN